MIRHLFMAEFKDDVSEEIRKKEIEDLRRMNYKKHFRQELHYRIYNKSYSFT